MKKLTPQRNMSPNPSSHALEETNNSPENGLHLVTEKGDQSIMWRSNQLTYIAQNRQGLPAVVAKKFGHQATKLDLSYNTLCSFKHINQFNKLNELILDNNNFEDDQLDFRQNLRLKTLSLNKNKLSNLPRLVNSIEVNFPNLEFLSLIGNPLCPKLILPVDSSQHDRLSSNQKVSDFEYQRYRYFIIYHLPNLLYLDSCPITEEERETALNGGYWLASQNEINGYQIQFQQQPRNTNSDNNIEALSRSRQSLNPPDSQYQSFGHRGNYSISHPSPEDQLNTTIEDTEERVRLPPEQMQVQLRHEFKSPGLGTLSLGRHLIWSFVAFIASTNLLNCSGTTIARLSLKYLMTSSAGKKHQANFPEKK